MRIKRLNESFENYPEICSGPFYGINDGDRYVEIGVEDTKNKFPGLSHTIRTPRGQGRRSGALFSFLTKEDAQKFIDKYLDSSYKPFLQRIDLCGKKFEVGNDFCYYQLSYSLHNGQQNPFINDSKIQANIDKKRANLDTLEQNLSDAFDQCDCEVEEIDLKNKILKIAGFPKLENGSIDKVVVVRGVSVNLKSAETSILINVIPNQKFNDMYSMVRHKYGSDNPITWLSQGQKAWKKIFKIYDCSYDKNLIKCFIEINSNDLVSDIVAQINNIKETFSNESLTELQKLVDHGKELQKPITTTLGKD